jgi:hypothetical protein
MFLCISFVILVYSAALKNQNNIRTLLNSRHIVYKNIGLKLIFVKLQHSIVYQQPIIFIFDMDYPRAFVSFPRIAGSGNEIVTKSQISVSQPHVFTVNFSWLFTVRFRTSFRTSQIRSQVQKFIMKFTNRFVNKASDWLLNQTIQSNAQFTNLFVNFIMNFWTWQRIREVRNEVRNIWVKSKLKSTVS